MDSFIFSNLKGDAMMRLSKSFRLSATAAVVCFLPAAKAQADQLQVVASFSILKDMVEQVAGEAATVTSLVGPDGDMHFFTSSPADARTVKSADLLVVNGLEFEGWIDRLIDASGFEGTMVVASDGIDVLVNEEDDHEDHEDHDDHKDHEDHEDHEDHDDHAEHEHGEFDPHAWQSLSRAAVYVDNITAALSEAHPEAIASFSANAAAYRAQIMALDAALKADFATIDEHCTTVVTSHDAFTYFGADYGVTFVAPAGLSTASEASAGDVAAIIKQIRDGGVSAAFVENITDNRLIDQIASETNLSMGGALYSGALSEADGPAATYLDMMAHNGSQLLTALRAADAAGLCADDHD